MFTKSFLSDLRLKAMRKGVWYRAIDRVDRGILDLTCKFVDRVKSIVLSSVLVEIVYRLTEALKGDFVRLLESVGCERAVRNAELARRWGYGDVHGWLRGLDFARYLALLEYHAPLSYIV